MREELINFARKQSLYKLMAEEYEEAAKIDDIIISINMQNLQEDSVGSDIFEQTYTIKQYLEQVHKQRIEAGWNRSATLTTFNKPSSKLFSDKKSTKGNGNQP